MADCLPACADICSSEQATLQACPSDPATSSGTCPLVPAGSQCRSKGKSDKVPKELSPTRDSVAPPCVLQFCLTWSNYFGTRRSVCHRCHQLCSLCSIKEFLLRAVPKPSQCSFMLWRFSDWCVSFCNVQLFLRIQHNHCKYAFCCCFAGVCSGDEVCSAKWPVQDLRSLVLTGTGGYLNDQDITRGNCGISKPAGSACTAGSGMLAGFAKMSRPADIMTFSASPTMTFWSCRHVQWPGDKCCQHILLSLTVPTGPAWTGMLRCQPQRYLQQM